MNDAEQIFRQTEIERKRLSYGDKHKKRGGGRYVRLPSDNLTRKEREAMNGEIITWKKKPFYTRQEFINLPNDEKLRWVNSLINLYGIGLATVDNVIFDGNGFIRGALEKNGLLQYVNKGVTGGAASYGKSKLIEDFKKYKNNSESPGDVDEIAPIEETPQAAPKQEQVNRAIPERAITIRQYSDACRALGVIEGVSEGVSTTAQAALLRSVKTLADIIEAMFQEAE